jgi:hypothetical protein
MPHHLLMISLAGGTDELSVHPAHDAAWDALLRYIDERWGAVTGPTEAPADDHARVDALFVLSESFYLVGEVVTTLPRA